MKEMLLVLDDEQDLLQLLKRSLEAEFDCHVETALSGAVPMETPARAAMSRMEVMGGVQGKVRYRTRKCKRNLPCAIGVPAFIASAVLLNRGSRLR